MASVNVVPWSQVSLNPFVALHNYCNSWASVIPLLRAVCNCTIWSLLSKLRICPLFTLLFIDYFSVMSSLCLCHPTHMWGRSLRYTVLSSLLATQIHQDTEEIIDPPYPPFLQSPITAKLQIRIALILLDSTGITAFSWFSNKIQRWKTAETASMAVEKSPSLITSIRSLSAPEFLMTISLE